MAVALSVRSMQRSQRSLDRPGRSVVSAPPGDEDLYQIPDEQLVALIRQHVIDSRLVKEEVEGHWLWNLAMLEGRQWAFWSQSLRRLVTPPKTRTELRYYANRIRGAVQSVVGQMLSGESDIVCMPSGRTEEHLERARVSEQLLHHLKRVLHEREVHKRLLTWAACVGVGILKTDWDALGGKLVSPELLREAGADPGLQVYEGEARKVASNPFNIFPNAGAVDPASMVSCTEVHRLHIDTVRRYWPRDRDIIRPDSAESDSTVQDGQVQFAYSRFGSGEPQPDVTKLCTVFEHRVFRQPGGSMPRGLKVFATNYGVLGERMPCEQWDVYKWFMYYERPGKFWPQGLIDDAKPVQIELNRSRGQLIQWKDKLSAPMWMVPSGSVSGGWTPDNRSNGVNRFIPVQGMRPEPLRIPPPPPALIAHIAALLEEFQEVTGVRDSLRGVAQFAGESGRHAAAMFEAAALRFVPQHNDWQALLERDGQDTVRIAHEMYQEERMLQFYGDDGRPEVQTFLGSRDIDPNVQVLVLLEPPGTNRSMRRQEILQAAKDGVLLDHQGMPDFRLLRRALVAGDTREVYDPDRAEKNDAKGENRLLVTAVQRPVHAIERHKAHLEAHIEGFLAAKRRGQLTPENEQVWTNHIGAHFAYLSAELSTPPGGGVSSAQPLPSPRPPPADAGGPAQPAAPDGGMAREEGMRELMAAPPV